MQEVEKIENAVIDRIKEEIAALRLVHEDNKLYRVYMRESKTNHLNYA